MELVDKFVDLSDFDRRFENVSIDMYSILDKLDLQFGIDDTRDLHKCWLDFRMCVLSFMSDKI